MKPLKQRPNCLVVLDDMRQGRACSVVFESPVAVLTASSPAEVLPALDAAELALASGHHVAGYFSYELGYLFEQRLASLLPACRSLPLLRLGIFEGYDRLSGEAAEGLFSDAGRAHAGRLAFEWGEQEYARRFERLHGLISAGDLYQANLSFRARFAFTGDPRALYRDLRQASEAGYCAYVDDAERQILSFSPELFFEISSDGLIRARPMKGTAARAADETADALARIRLVASDKDRAENLMIVDLLRNDLARVAEPGSVRVESLFEVETYPTVHQLVSAISARRAQGASPANILRALFPCGSVTGAPKIRAMEVLRELETSPRGAYCGAIGAFHPDGSARFNVAIRTLTISNNCGELGIGGGVVYDSCSGSEYAECLLKARYFEAARVPLQLIETLRYDPASPVLLVREARHLARMVRSAAAFGICFDVERARALLMEAVAGAQTSLRVRLVLSETGELSVSVALFDASIYSLPWRYAICDVRVNSADVLLRHKTHRRELFERSLASAVRDFGADEILFLNERGELTEGSRTNIFVEIDGRLLTPRLSCGLLDGCLRQELVETGRCAEAVLLPADLMRADAVYLGNSLRGLIRAAFVGDAKTDRISAIGVGERDENLPRRT